MAIIGISRIDEFLKQNNSGIICERSAYIYINAKKMDANCKKLENDNRRIGKASFFLNGWGS